ncbi:hypothetical protein C8R44DRAFT_733371 [Mycena epipterygia]|nr:hypothetical protein C8R44DRAFT_733371 [Mycena epipterygia]
MAPSGAGIPAGARRHLYLLGVGRGLWRLASGNPAARTSARGNLAAETSARTLVQHRKDGAQRRGHSRGRAASSLLARNRPSSLGRSRAGIPETASARNPRERETRAHARVGILPPSRAWAAPVESCKRGVGRPEAGRKESEGGIGREGIARKDDREVGRGMEDEDSEAATGRTKRGGRGRKEEDMRC